MANMAGTSITNPKIIVQPGYLFLNKCLFSIKIYYECWFVLIDCLKLLLLGHIVWLKINKLNNYFYSLLQWEFECLLIKLLR